MDKRKPKKFNGRGIAKFGNIAGEALSTTGEGLSLLGQPEIGVPLMVAGGVAHLGSGLLKSTYKKKSNPRVSTRRTAKKK